MHGFFFFFFFFFCCCLRSVTYYSGHDSIGGNGGFADAAGLAAARYDAEPGTAYLLRPDGYVAARFRHPTPRGLDARWRKPQATTEVSADGAIDRFRCQA